MLFRQLFDSASSTYTYLLADERSRKAALIDPVREQIERDVDLLRELGLQLALVLETHVHADHVTSAGALRQRLGAQTVFSRNSGNRCADVPVDDGSVLDVGALRIEVRTTPGHTNGDVTYVVHDAGMAFTGDALLIRGCGRTDFQQGDARKLFRSVHEKIFTLPDETLIYPAHDYKGRTVTTVGEEKRLNPRLGGGKTEAEFVAIMAGLNLPKPKAIDEAVPSNLRCGMAPTGVVRADSTTNACGVPEVTPSWVAAHRDVRIVDVREPEELSDELGCIVGAENVPLMTLKTVAQRWRRDDELVVVCRSGGRSGDATAQLQRMGFTEVASMAGGMLRWRREGLPVAQAPISRATP